jgi:methylamine dehydrogenase accessory protein MauD
VKDVLLIVRVGLALVFAAAAVGKLADLGAARQAVERFGLPVRLSRWPAVVLPLTELAAAGAFLFVGAARWAALAAIGLLLLFCVAIVRVLVRGETLKCNCFGSLGSAPVGRGTLARNVGLAGAAVFVAVAGWNGGGTSAFAWTAQHAGLAALAAVVAVLGTAQLALSWQLFKQNGRLLARVADLEATAGSSDAAAARLAVGEAAPGFELPDLDGLTVGLDDLLAAGRGALLVFTDPACGHCAPLLPVFAAAQAGGVEMPVAVISTGDERVNRANAEEHGLEQVLLQERSEVAERYRIYGVPGAIRLDRDGRVASAHVEGTRTVRELLESVSAPTVLAAGGAR